MTVLSIKATQNSNKKCGTQQNDTQYNNKHETLSVMLWFVSFMVNVEDKPITLSVVMLSVVNLSVVAPLLLEGNREQKNRETNECSFLDTERFWYQMNINLLVLKPTNCWQFQGTPTEGDGSVQLTSLY